jgi:hypothetical protein
MTETVQGARVCANPRCGNLIVRRSHFGPDPKYCSSACWGTATTARKYRTPPFPAPAAPLPAPPVKTRAQQLREYFELLVRLAEKAEDKQRRDDLFDRIERTLKAIEGEDRPPVPCGLGWPS